MIARVGSVLGQRFGVPLDLVRANPADPSVGAHVRALLQAVVRRLAADEVAVTDREFTVALLLAAGVQAWVTRLRKNFTARRATPPAYRGRGRRPIYGELVRPLARRRGQRDLPATPPDQEIRWTEAGRALRAEQWQNLVLTDAAPGSRTFSVTAICPERSRRTRPTSTRCCWPRRWRWHPRTSAGCTATAGRSNSSRSRPNRCWARPGSSCMPRKPVSGSRSSPCSLGRS